MVKRLIILPLAAGLLAGILSSCGGGIDPALGARLIFEEQITDNIKGQIILSDDDLLNSGDGGGYST